MFDQALRISRQLRDMQRSVAQLTQQLFVLMSMREGAKIHAKFEFGGRVVDHVGVVRVLTDASFFLELNTGSLLMVEELISVEILSTAEE